MIPVKACIGVALVVTAVLVANAFGLFVASTAAAQTSSPKPEPWLLQSLHLTGSPVEGFKKTCLVVYKNGDFHREQRRQFSESGRAQYEWQAPEVFEGKLTGDDINALEAILESPEFLALTGAVGGGRDLWSQLLFNRQGAVIPDDNIEIMTVAVARSNTPQVFEVADFDVARRQEPLGAFLRWTKTANGAGYNVSRHPKPTTAPHWSQPVRRHSIRPHRNHRITSRSHSQSQSNF